MAERSRYKTKQMSEVLAFLESTKGRHVTAAEVCEHFKSAGISVGTATVYRNLERLVEQGLAAKYVIDGTTSACFEYIGEHKPENKTACYHCKCEKCGKLIHLQCSEVESLIHLDKRTLIAYNFVSILTNRRRRQW